MSTFAAEEFVVFNIGPNRELKFTSDAPGAFTALLSSAERRFKSAIMLRDSSPRIDGILANCNVILFTCAMRSMIRSVLSATVPSAGPAAAMASSIDCCRAARVTDRSSVCESACLIRSDLADRL